jgi:thiamine biosynthesis lipoprotein
MGSSVDVVVVGGSAELLDVASISIGHLERCWSRFLPDSDISRLNHAAGSTVHIDPATTVLLEAMIEGWRATAGAFDPTLLVPLVSLGYAASWSDPAAVTSVPAGAMLRSDLDELLIDRAGNVAAAPRGMCLDAGGIGKGLAADLVVEQLIDRGALGASVSIGGDVAVRGLAPEGAGWLIGITDALSGGDTDVEVGQLMLVEGGVATSGTLRRRWIGDDGTSVHHLLDPLTGRPARHTHEIVAVTVIAGTAAWAEVWTKAVMVRGTAVFDDLDGHGLGACVTFADASTTTNQGWASYDVSAEQRGDVVGEKVEMLEVRQIEHLQVDPFGAGIDEAPDRRGSLLR